MDHKTVEEFILGLPDATLDYPFGKDVAVYKVHDKMFALIAEGKNPVQISLKSVMPGYHLNKKHWNTIVLTGQLGWDEIKDLIRLSYQLATGT